MQFGLRAFLVLAPAINSWILIALACAAAALADSASRCRRCYRVFCAPCTPAFEPVLVLYIYFLALATAFRHAATASVGVASTCRLCSFLWYWFGDTAFGPPAIDCGPFSHWALLAPAPAVNLWILIALARRGCPCRFRVATGRYAWLRRAALLPRLCRGCGLVCMEVCYTYLCSLFWQIFCLSTDWKALNWRDDG